MVPTTTSGPTPVPTATYYEVNSFSALSSAINTNAQINVVTSITFTAAITISGKTNVEMSSSTGAVLSSDRSFSVDDGGMFYIESGSDVTFTGLGFTSGSAEDDGGCLYTTGSSTVEVEDVEFISCSAGWVCDGLHHTTPYHTICLNTTSAPRLPYTESLHSTS